MAAASKARLGAVSANMHKGSLRAVRLGSTENFTRDRRHLADPQGEETQQVHRRVAFGPLEVDVGLPSRVITQVQQQGGQGVGHGRAFHLQDAMALVRDMSVDVEDRREL